MQNVTLRVENLISSYGKFKISHVTFNLESGNILGLVGRSGSGKSTLIKTLIGLKKADAGKISFFLDNKKIDFKTVIGYSPQDNSLYHFLTLEENLITFARLHNVNSADIKTRMNYILGRLNLKNCKTKMITELSGGMRKRADLAVTLMHDPQILILDEPFNGLDISLQEFIWDLLRDLSSQGKIIIISSHMLSDIQKNCNRFGLIEKGVYYNTKEVMDTIKSRGETNLEQFLHKLFSAK